MDEWMDFDRGIFHGMIWMEGFGWRDLNGGIWMEGFGWRETQQREVTLLFKPRVKIVNMKANFMDNCMQVL